MFRHARAVFGTFVFALTLLAVAGAVFCHVVLRVPRTHGPKPAASEIRIVAPDGSALQASWFPAGADLNGCVVILHGIGDSRAGEAGFAPVFQKAGYAVLIPDSRAHGDSGGEFVTYGLLEKFDVAQWVTRLRKLGCAKVYGLGESLGASILIQAAAITPNFEAIVAECPFANLRQMGANKICRTVHLPRLIAQSVVAAGFLYARFSYGFNFDDAETLRSIARTSTPILLIHGLKDQRTPPEQSQQLAAAASGKHELWLVPEAGHTQASLVAPKEFWIRVLKWFSAPVQTSYNGR